MVTVKCCLNVPDSNCRGGPMYQVELPVPWASLRCHGTWGDCLNTLHSFLLSGVPLEVEADGRVVTVGANSFLPTPKDPQYCGQVVAILHIDSGHQVSEVFEFNNYLSDVITLACSDEGKCCFNADHMNRTGTFREHFVQYRVANRDASYGDR